MKLFYISTLICLILFSCNEANVVLDKSAPEIDILHPNATHVKNGDTIQGTNIFYPSIN